MSLLSQQDDDAVVVSRRAGLWRLDSPARLTERPSFQSVYRQYFDFVWSTAWRYGVRSDAIEDLVQEVFLVIHTRLHTLERPAALRSWIYGVVRRTASQYHRRTRRARMGPAYVVTSTSAEVICGEPTPLERTERNARLELLARLLARLDVEKREVFELVELEELTVPEVAELIGIPLNTAYSRLRAARQAFNAAQARYLRRERRA